MKTRLLLVGAVLLASCSGPDAPLVVKQFKVQDTTEDLSGDPMVRNEKQRRLHGAVSTEEKRQRLGMYYTVLWRDSAGPGEVEVLFEYLQGGSASKVLRRSKRFAATETSGTAEFAVTGMDFIKNGRVTAWQVTLSRGGRVIASERSYLWQKRPGGF